MQLFLGFFYFNANTNSIHVKPVNGKYRIPIFLSSSVSFFLFWLSRLLSVARRHAPLSLPVPGSVPRLLVRALCQGMNNTAPRLPAASKWGVRVSGRSPQLQLQNSSREDRQLFTRGCRHGSHTGGCKGIWDGKNLKEEHAPQARENPIIF